MGVSGFTRRFNCLFLRTKTYPFGYIQSRALSDSKTFSSNDAELPVLIVGAGPVGLVLSILLTKLGIFFIHLFTLFTKLCFPVFRLLKKFESRKKKRRIFLLLIFFGNI